MINVRFLRLDIFSGIIKVNNILEDVLEICLIYIVSKFFDEDLIDNFVFIGYS